MEKKSDCFLVTLMSPWILNMIDSWDQISSLIGSNQKTNQANHDFIFRKTEFAKNRLGWKFFYFWRMQDFAGRGKLLLSFSFSLSPTHLCSHLYALAHTLTHSRLHAHTHSSVCLLMRSRPCGDVRCQLFQKVGNLFRANEEVGESGRERERQRMRNVDKVIESGSLRTRDVLKRKR